MSLPPVLRNSASWKGRFSSTDWPLIVSEYLEHLEHLEVNYMEKTKEKAWMTLTCRSSCSLKLIRAEFKVPFLEKLAPKISLTSPTLSSLPAAQLFPQSQLQPLSVHELPSSPITLCSASCDVILKLDSLTAWLPLSSCIGTYGVEVQEGYSNQKISSTASYNSSPERTLQKPRKNLKQKPREYLGKTRDLWNKRPRKQGT